MPVGGKGNFVILFKISKTALNKLPKKFTMNNLRALLTGLALLLGMLLQLPAQAQIIISQYVETDSGTDPKGVELWNASDSTIDFTQDKLEILLGRNGGTPSVEVSIDTGSLGARQLLVIGTSGIINYVDSILPDTQYVSENFNFNGDDALVVVVGGDTTDVFGQPGNDPGSSWSCNGVSTAAQNIALKAGISSGDTVGFTDPSTRFITISSTPSNISGGGLAGFGILPAEAIGDIRGDDANGDPIRVRQRVRLQATVTSINFELSRNPSWMSFYVQDASGGISVFETSVVDGYEVAEPGDSLEIFGRVDAFNGLTQILPDSIVVLDSNVSVPAPVALTDPISPQLESQRVRIDSVRFVSGINYDGDSLFWGNGRFSFQLAYTDGADTFLVDFQNETDLFTLTDSTRYVDSLLTISGVLRHDTRNPGFGAFYLQPNGSEDFEVIDNEPGFLDISELFQVDADVIPVLDDSSGAITGIVTAPYIDGDRFQFGLADSTDGVVVDNDSNTFGYTPELGDSVIVYGRVAFFNGLIQFRPDSIDLVDSNKMAPAPRVVSALNEDTEGDLIRLDSVALVDPSQWDGDGGDFNVEVTNGTDTFTARIWSNAGGLSSQSAPLGRFDLIGIGGQFDDFSAPYDEGYQILPRFPADIQRAPGAPATLTINEFLADNESVIADQDGEFDDWIELYNFGQDTVDLAGFTLTDDRTQPMRYTFPDTSLAPNGYLIVWADGDPNQDGLHADFGLSAGGEEIFLYDVQGQPLDSVVFAAQAEDTASGRLPNGSGAFQQVKPTPGAANEAFPPALETIAAVAVGDADGEPLREGERVRIRGVVTTINFEQSRNPSWISFYVQDATDAINIFERSAVSGYEVAIPGDSVEITGEVGVFNGLTEIFPDSIQLLGTTATPQPIRITETPGESLESQRVQLDSVRYIDSLTYDGDLLLWGAGRFSFQLLYTNGVDTFLVDIQNETDLFGIPDSTPFVDSLLNIRGVVRHDSRNPGFGAYYLQPNGVEDIDFLMPSGLAGSSRELTIDVYPNPARQRLMVVLPQAVHAEEVAVLNTLGQSVITRRGSIQGRLAIAVAELPEGVYLLSVVTEDGRRSLQRFIKR